MENYPKKPVSGIYSDSQQVYYHIKSKKLALCSFFPSYCQIYVNYFIIIFFLYFTMQSSLHFARLHNIFNLSLPAQMNWSW